MKSGALLQFIDVSFSFYAGEHRRSFMMNTGDFGMYVKQLEGGTLDQVRVFIPKHGIIISFLKRRWKVLDG